MKYWIEKTLVKGRKDRVEGDRKLGKALWSPQKDKRGGDIYKNMRHVEVGDRVIHLIDNSEIAGISIVKKNAQETFGLPGTNWDGPAYLIELESYIQLNPSLYKSDLLIPKYKNLLLDISEKSEVFYNKILSLRQGAYLTPCPVKLLSLINKVYKAKSNKDLPHIDSTILENLGQENSHNEFDRMAMKDILQIVSIKTKPFIILAGLSGTGKSRLVRTLAYKSNNIKSDSANKIHPPSNFQLIKVKPNWHDSSELLGYESRISGKDRFVTTDFIRFIVKAWQHPETPFFLCLDEMNLAPVEQYFAEYLSAVETRRMYDGKIRSDALISSALIRKYAENADGVDDAYDLWAELELSDSDIQEELKQKGISLPENLIVMGTVNMDETTHSFSRKVLDRAMTMEMNDIDLVNIGLSSDSDDWDYPAAPIPYKMIIPDKTQGSEVYKELGDRGEAILDYLVMINDHLEGSPFKIAYRVRDEFLLYAYNFSLLEERPDNWLTVVLDEMTLMKILPRIEGDEERTRLLDKLITIFQELDLKKSEHKAKEMIERRKISHYTSFWI